jgi:hypothetical protein
MTRKPLGQIAYESIFKSLRVPHPTTNYPAAWNVVAKAVERAIRRREKILEKNSDHANGHSTRKEASHE